MWLVWVCKNPGQQGPWSLRPLIYLLLTCSVIDTPATQADNTAWSVGEQMCELVTYKNRASCIKQRSIRQACFNLCRIRIKGCFLPEVSERHTYWSCFNIVRTESVPQTPISLPELLLLGYLGLRLLRTCLKVSRCKLELEMYEMWRCLEFPCDFHLKYSSICSIIIISPLLLHLTTGSPAADKRKGLF